MLSNVLQCAGQRTTQHKMSAVPVLKSPGIGWTECQRGGGAIQMRAVSRPLDFQCPEKYPLAALVPQLSIMVSDSVKKRHFERPGQHEGKKGKPYLSRPSE